MSRHRPGIGPRPRVNRHYIVVAALKALSEQGTVPAAKVAEAIAKYGIKADKTNPLYA